MTKDQLIGHDEALGALSRAISDPSKEGGALILTGERGVGRTACVAAAREMARGMGWQVVETLGVRAESKFAFASLQRLLSPIIDLAESLPSAQRSALHTAIGIKEGPAPDLLVVSLAVLGLFKEASRDTHLLIAVDDIDVVDAATFEVLLFVARRLASGQLIVAATPGGQSLHQLPGTFREVALERLSPAESDELLDRHAPDLDEDRKAWVRAHALGNPLALVELAAVASTLDVLPGDPFDTQVPLNPVLERAFGEQLAELPLSSLDGVLVSALDRECSIQEVLAATTLLCGDSATVEIFDAPRAAGLLTYDESRVTFSHPLVRAAVTFREPVSRQQAAHRALGEAIVMNVGRRTWHRAVGTSGRDELIAAELERHGAECARKNDSDRAVRAWERAAQLSVSAAESGRRLLLAASRAADMGQFALADQLLASARQRDLSEFDRVRASLLQDEWSDPSDDSDRVLRLCAQARRASAEGQMDLSLGLAYAASLSGSSAVQSSSTLSEIVQLTHELPHDPKEPGMLAFLARADPIGYGRYVMETLSTIPSESVAEVEKLIMLSVAARDVGAYTRGLEFLEEAQISLRTARLDGQLARLLTLEVDLRLEVGDWDGAAGAIAEVKSLSGDERRPVRHGESLAMAAKFAALRGDVATALKLVVQAEHCPTARRGSPTLAIAQIAKGIAYIASRRHLDAYNALGHLFDPRSPSHHVREQFGAVMYVAEAAVRCGRHEGARSIVNKMEPIASTSGSPLLLSHLQYARAVLAPDDDAEECFLDCLSSDLAAWPWSRARVQLAYGRWLRRQQRVNQARGPLSAAESTFQDIGAVQWAAEALDELEASGRATQELLDETTAVSLSVRELKIARLAATGLSNNEIGQQLGVSPRTVSSHLYRIFPKLGISARAQLASRLGQLVE
jgi:DNA-binding CsgD family transcriptional regulator